MLSEREKHGVSELLDRMPTRDLMSLTQVCSPLPIEIFYFQQPLFLIFPSLAFRPRPGPERPGSASLQGTTLVVPAGFPSLHKQQKLT